MALTWIICTNCIHMSWATLFPLTPQLQINFHSPGSRSCQAVSSWPATERCFTDTPGWKTMAVISKRLINISGIAEKGKNSEKMASCYLSWPGFQESWVSGVDTSKSSSGAAGTGQCWAAEAAPLLLQCMSKIERNGVKIHLPGTSSYLNNPVYCPLAMVLCHVSQTNYLHNPKLGTSLLKEGQTLGAADPQLWEIHCIVLETWSLTR